MLNFAKVLLRNSMYKACMQIPHSCTLCHFLRCRYCDIINNYYKNEKISIFRIKRLCGSGH